ncbi:MAG TPA: DNA polymerase III subunit alpha [bacterium]|nr:DNA polymerase III subunit alpha [bacterium]
MASDFVHLHLHTAYSLLDGAIRIPDLTERVLQYGMPAVAITDHGNMFGVIDFYQAMTRAGVKPIIGCEAYITPKDRRDRTERLDYHLVLLARNLTGYHNLVRLISFANIEGFYYHPRIDYELLERYSDGLIGLSACLGGEIARAITAGRLDDARQIAGRYSSIFGPENFYLELQENGMREQAVVNRELIRIAGEMNLPLVATNDCHYLDEEDYRAHDILLCIRDGRTVHDPDRFRYESQAFYLRSGEEMERLFREVPEAVRNTAAIAEKCHLTLELDSHELPDFDAPHDMKLEEYLDRVAHEGLEDRLRSMPYTVNRDEYEERLRDELKIIGSMGFAGYFLIVWDFLKYAHTSGIPVGPGRGSGAGSLVAYALQITDLDPMPHDLLFERFLNPARVSMPDFDIDFCKNRRDEVITYVTEKYGENSVGQIATFSTMKSKLVIRDVGRAMDLPLQEVNTLAKLIPEDLKMTLPKALEQEPKLRAMVDKNAEYQDLFRIAQRLEGLSRHCGVHAAGIVIANGNLWDRVPVKCEDNHIVTQYAKNEVEKAGLVKFDFLGLKTLTVIDTAQKIVNATRPGGMEKLNVRKLNLADPAVYDLISSGDTYGIFQMESSGFQLMVKQMKPSCFGDIVAAVALYRPGPMEQIPRFIARKHGDEAIHYPHEDLRRVLEPTYGLIVYQEQVMQISRIMAGFSLGHADILRRAMGKKKEEEMLQMRRVFIHGDAEMGVDGALKRGYSEKLATEVFDLMQKFAKYGFNKSHAAGYAVLSYQTAYLKCFHRKEFMAALLTCDADSSDKVVKGINECRRTRINVLPPHVNDSLKAFTVVEDGIRFGLAAVKNVGMGAVESIICARREEGPFTSLFDFCRRIDLHSVNKRVVESLIKAGAFDGLGGNRAQLLAMMDTAYDIGQQAQHDKAVGQRSLFEMLGGSAENRHNPDPAMPDVPELSLLARLQGEKETLGFYVTGHPLLSARLEVDHLSTHSSSDLENVRDDDLVTVCGIPAGVKRINTRRGDQMAFLNLQDMDGSIEVTVRPEIWVRERDLIESESILVVQGRTSGRDDQVRVVADSIRDISNARREMIRSMIIGFAVTPDADKRSYDLHQLIKNYPGRTAVTLRMLFPAGPELESVTVDLGDEFRVDLVDHFLEKLTEIPDMEIIGYRNGSNGH